MVPGLNPMDAAERLRNFRAQFDVNKGKWDNYSSGEELFGLVVTRYPELEDIEDKIKMLDKLYSLYVSVIQTIKGYGDVVWTEVVTNIDNMTTDVNSFQAKAKTLPKALRDWPAYKDCRKTIDDFLELLPIVQALTHPAVRTRHWESIRAVTGADIPFDQACFPFVCTVLCENTARLCLIHYMNPLRNSCIHTSIFKPKSKYREALPLYQQVVPRILELQRLKLTTDNTAIFLASTNLVTFSNCGPICYRLYPPNTITCVDLANILVRSPRTL